MGEGAVLASSPAKSWLEINQQLTRPAKCGAFYCLELWATPKLTEEQNILSMSRRTAAIAAALSIVPLGCQLNKENEVPFATQHFNQGTDNYEQGNYQDAINDFTNALKIVPNDAESYYARGLAKDNLGDHQGAIADFTKAIENNPQERYAYLNRGVAKAKLEDYQGAVVDHTKAIEIYPGFVSAFEERGIAKESLNDLYGACLDWRMAEDLFESGERDGGGKESIEWVKNKC